MIYLGKFKYILALAVFFLLACTKTEPPPQKTGDNNYPDSRLDDATIVFSQDGKQSVNIIAKHIDRWEKIDSTEAEIVELIFYDKHGSRRSNLKANRGVIHEKSEKVSLFGDVVAVNKDSTVLKTQSLFWDPETELMTTDDYVEIERADGDILTGYGLKADRNLQEIEILRDVSGKVIEIPEPAISPKTEPDTVFVDSISDSTSEEKNEPSDE